MIYFASSDTPPTLFEQITGQPFIVSLLLIGALFFVLYTLLEKAGVKGLQRVLVFIPALLVLAVLYFQHGPLIATVLLSVGFLLSFILAFAQLAGKK